ncbi:MAG TPA: hypothetical protein VKK79_21385, partial [Candidatus Lokiarchaeia archaeon]|nr:hypothetical protein [Candidatus Lokiarchaeia archaeon]
PMYDTTNYSNNTDTVWYVNAWKDFSNQLDGPGTSNFTTVNYIQLQFQNNTQNPVLDFQDGDNLTFYDNNIYNPANPSASLLATYTENNNSLNWFPFLGTWGQDAKTPWFETDNLRIEFVSNTHSQPHWGFHVDGVNFWHDGDFDNIPQGNFTPWTTMDTHPYGAQHRAYFNASALAAFDNFTSNAWPVISPPSSGNAPQFSSKGSSTWDLLWWLQYNYDFRYLLSLFNEDEYSMFNWLYYTAIQGGEANQIALMYGELPLPNGTLLKDVPGYPTMSPLHERMDFMTGGPFSAMIPPMQDVWVYQPNATTGGYDHLMVDYQSRYGVPDAPDGADGPYAADCVYITQLLYSDPSSGFSPANISSTVGDMLNLAITQDSRDPNSVWQMMNQAEFQKWGNYTGPWDALNNRYDGMDMTFANVHPLSLIDVVQALSQVPSTSGSPTSSGIAPRTSGFSVTSLLGGVDMMQFLNYVENHTNSSLGTVLRSLQISTYDMLTYIIEHVHPDPADAPQPFPVATALAFTLQAQYQGVNSVTIALGEKRIAACVTNIYRDRRGTS